MPSAKKAPPRKTATVTEKVEAVKTENILEAVKAHSPESIATQFTKVQLDVSKKLAEVGNQATQAIGVLRDVEAAIATKRQELRDLYAMTDEAVTLDSLKREIDATREQWDAEAADVAARRAAEDAELQRLRARERTEYEYAKAMERRKSQDEYDAQVAAKKKAEAERAELLVKGWEAREAAVKAAEKELIDLRAQVGAFPEVVKREVDKAVAVATSALKRHMEMEERLRQKDAETALALSRAETAAARAEAERLAVTAGELRAQVDQASRSVQSIAEKAMDAQSGRQSLHVLQESLARDPAPAPSGKGR